MNQTKEPCMYYMHVYGDVSPCREFPSRLDSTVPDCAGRWRHPPPGEGLPAGDRRGGGG